jgi:acetamidase/formamidase
MMFELLPKEPEQEPVAWRAWVSKFPQGTGSDWVYVTKPIMKDSIHNQPLYTTPPQRKPLTDEEIYSITGVENRDEMMHRMARNIARAIEAAHGIKGEA